MATKKQLVATAKELNEVLELDPKINLTQKVQGLENDIIEAVDLIEEDDILSEETWEVINELVPEGEDEDENEDDDEDDGADEEDEAEANEVEEDEAEANEVEEDDDEEDEEEEDEEDAPETEKQQDKKRPSAASVKKPVDISGKLTGQQKTMTDIIDEVILVGGSWEKVFANLKSLAEDNGLEGAEKKCTPGVIREHVRWRIKRGWVNVAFPGSITIKVTDEGIEVKKNK